MTQARARQRAERCFALARSTTFEGERASAIARGTSIAKAAGLSLDLFDIPGRTAAARPAAPAGKAPEFYTSQDVADVMRSFNQHMADASFERMQRDLARTAQAKRAADWLYAAGTRTYANGPGWWFVTGVGQLSDAELVAEAVNMGFGEAVA